MRLFNIGAVALAALVAASPAFARAVRMDVPVEIDPDSPVHILWVKVKADGERTLVSGYVRQKRWFARRKGDLHILFLRGGQQIACQETPWVKTRRHSHGQWRFATSVNVAAATVDAVRIIHVTHDPQHARAFNPTNTCSGLTAPTDPKSHGA